MNTSQNNISFIPKKPLAKDKSSRPRSLFLTLSFILFAISISMYGGLYFYEEALSIVLEEKEIALDTEKNKVDPTGIIDRATNLQNKTAGAREILSKHIASSLVFDLLEEITLRSVYFDEYTFSRAEAKEGNMSSGYTVTVSGIVPGFASLAAQSDAINKEISDKKRITSFSISDIALDDSGNVKFRMTMNLPVQSLYYGNTLEQDETFTLEDFADEELLLDSNFADEFESTGGEDINSQILE